LVTDFFCPPALKVNLEGFFLPLSKEIVMVSKLKRILLRKKLKKEKVRLLCDLMEVKRKLKILDELDKEDKEK